jgi:hypothetical protein
MEGLPNTNVFINQFTDGPSSDDSSGIHKWWRNPLLGNDPK